jgi:regulator of protease activity HflC (stomatin/prohibitin superfamily)
MIDLPKQKVFTKDNISVIIDTVCFYRVVDPYRASFIVNDLVGSIVQITYVTLRIICGEYVQSRQHIDIAGASGESNQAQ